MQSAVKAKIDREAKHGESLPSFPPCLAMPGGRRKGTGHGSTGSFPGDFAEPGKWFRQSIRDAIPTDLTMPGRRIAAGSGRCDPGIKNLPAFRLFIDLLAGEGGHRAVEALLAEVLPMSSV